MDSLLSSTDRTKTQKNKVLSNYDIQRIYLDNKYSEDDIWRKDLYLKISRLAISRIKKYKNFSDKEDLLQELYLAIWQAIKTFDPHKNFNFYRWNSWYMNKAVRNFLNKKRRFCSINLLDDNTSMTLNLEDEVILLKKFLEYTRTVSERDHRIIRSYYFENNTLAEIGNIEGLSVEGVRKIHKKVIEKYRRKIKLGDDNAA